MMYKVPLSAVEKMESQISSSLRKLLGIPPSFTNIGLYGRETKLQLPFTALTEEFKVSKARMALTIERQKTTVCDNESDVPNRENMCSAGCSDSGNSAVETQRYCR